VRLAYVLVIYFLFVVAFSIMTTSFALFTMYRFGFDAAHNGYMFMFVGIVGAIIQGGLIGRLAKKFGELPLTVVGSLLFALSLLAIPFTSPQTGLTLLLAVGALFAIGNSLSTPSLTSLASKSAGKGEQGGVLGVTQSVASLARAVGPALSAWLIYSAIAYPGRDGKTHNLSDASMFHTFGAAAAIMFVAFLLALYFARTHARDREFAHNGEPVASAT
jgi:DHA1 family tetracycline resistance protein-like MFS transporter